MERLLKRIYLETRQLEETRLCKWLADRDAEDHFNFVPSMLFFVLGFKDILASMKTSNPRSAAAVEVNTHCEEDLDHWIWYLQDLQKLGFTESSWGNTPAELFGEIWSDANLPVRDLVYTCIRYIKTYNDPHASLVLIEILEAAFGIFIKHMGKAVVKADLYNQLNYFGRVHIEKEAAHTRGAWLDGVRTMLEQPLSDHASNDAFVYAMEEMITDISERFHIVFDCWYQARNNFSPFPGHEGKATARAFSETRIPQ